MTSGVAAPTLHPTLTVVSHFDGLCDRSPCVRREHGYSSHRRQVFKSLSFVPLPKLPSALERLNHVFQVFGLPQDIGFDRRPQFSSRVWLAFCKIIGATASLSSGFHPQSNGEAEPGATVPVPGGLGGLRRGGALMGSGPEHFR